MTMTSDLMEAFQVLAQSADDLKRYCPRGEESLLYRRVDEDGFFDNVWWPSKALAMTCASIIHDQFHRISNDTVRQVASEILSLITIMIELKSDYHWGIDKEAYWIQGPNDGSWAVLRRLAGFGLAAVGSAVQPPQKAFHEFLKLGEFSEWRIVPGSSEQGHGSP